MSAGKLEDNALGSFLDGIEIGADAVAGLPALARDLLLVRDEADGAAHVDEDRSALNALNGAGDDLSFLLAEFAHDGDLLRFAVLLDDDLLGGLSGDAAEVGLGFKRENQLVADS